MAKARFGARVSAATFLAGVCVAFPQGTAIATADGPDGADSAPASSADSHPARASKPGPRGGAGHTPRPSSADDSSARTALEAIPVRPAATERPTDVATGPSANPRRSRATPDTAAPAAATAVRDSPAAAVQSPAPASTDPATATPAAPVTEQPVPAPTAPATASSTIAPAAAVLTAAPAAAATASPPSAARPGAVAAATISAGTSANAASASLIDRLLAPIRTLFGEGTALLVRRAFFNQAPTVTPVQLTGQSEGPITGTIGAVDLEQDPLSYTITRTPLHGSAVVNSDGSYTYTPGTDFTGTDSFVVAVADVGRHLNLLDLSRPASTSASVAVAQGALAAMLRFQFVYGAGSQYWSSAARSALESAATTLSSYLVVDSPVTVTYAVTGARSPFSSTLASAGSDFVNDGSGFLQTVVQSKILSGVDANGSAADGTIDWNFGPSWAFGTSVSNTQYDFQSIAMHELLHTMGFLSNIDKAGSNTGQVWTVFDSYVTNASGVRVINSDDFTWNTTYNTNLTGGSGGLYFGGPDAIAAYGSRVPLYTPNPWEPGSSLSHLSDYTFSGSTEKLMNAVTSTGPGITVISPLELGMLADIGYTVTSGGGTPVLLFVGFFTLRVRRRNV